MPFDCEWPRGHIWANGSLTSGDVSFTEADCGYMFPSARASGLYPDPHVVEYIPSTSVAREVATNLCIPASCVWAVPGEPPRCDEECQVPVSGRYFTTYTVDRSACGDADAGGP